MAKHTFVTVSHLTGDETRTVDILTRADVRKIVAEVIGLEVGDIDGKLKMQERKLAKTSEQTATAAKDAAAAKEGVKRLVETARETFREVIEELLVPHYRLLAQHLGIELPTKLTSVASKNRTSSTRKTASATKPPATSKKKTTKKTAASRSVRKGGKLCRYK